MGAAGATVATTAALHASPALAGPSGDDLPAYPPSLRQNAAGNAEQLASFMAYDPATDPLAPYFRSYVPLAEQITPDHRMQPNQAISSLPKILNIERHHTVENPDIDPDTGEQHHDGYLANSRYGYGNHVIVPRQVSYVDYACGWNGAGIIMNTAYVDRCHRNGILALGVFYCPFVIRGENAGTILERAEDGSFPVGDKLVDLAHYFGYDGYFLNIECTNIRPDQAKDMMELYSRMKARAKSLGMPAWHTQIYDSFLVDGRVSYRNKLDEQNSGWLTETGGVDSMFVNYAWPLNFPEGGWDHPGVDYVAPSVEEAKRLGLDPFETLFFGLEYQLPGNGNHAVGLDAYGDEILALNGEGDPVASLALFVSSDNMRMLGRRELGLVPETGSWWTGEFGDGNEMVAAALRAEERFWSGPSTNPAVRVEPSTATPRETFQRDYEPVYGIANFFAANSVIGSLPFTTRFADGAGQAFFSEGTRTCSDSWFNAGIQDILPTWQWWRRSLDTLEPREGLLTAGLRTDLAFDGPSSLRIHGDRDQTHGTEVMLYKCALELRANSHIAVTYREGSDRSARSLRIGLVPTSSLVEGEHPQSVLLELPTPKEIGDGWLRSVVRIGPNLKALGGRKGRLKVSALSLAVVAGTGAYDVTIGELAVRENADEAAPAAPSGLRLVATRTEDQGVVAGLAWDMDPSLWYYDIHRVDGEDRTWVGRVLSDCYLAGRQPAGATTFAVTAVSHAGVGSEPATIAVDL